MIDSRERLLPQHSEGWLENLRKFNRLIAEKVFCTKSDSPRMPSEEDIRTNQGYKQKDRETNYYENARRLKTIAKVHGFNSEDNFAYFLGSGRVLNVGAGSSTLSRELRNRRPDSDTISMDIVQPPDNLRLGKYVLANAASLPFPDATFDRLVATYSAPYWIDRPDESLACFREEMRVTREGGYLLISPFIDGLPVKAASVIKAMETQIPLHPADTVELYTDMLLIDQLFAWEASGEATISLVEVQSLSVSALALALRKN